LFGSVISYLYARGFISAWAVAPIVLLAIDLSYATVGLWLIGKEEIVSLTEDLDEGQRVLVLKAYNERLRRNRKLDIALVLLEVLALALIGVGLGTNTALYKAGSILVPSAPLLWIMLRK
jgi:hypothetical protein